MGGAVTQVAAPLFLQFLPGTGRGTTTPRGVVEGLRKRL